MWCTHSFSIVLSVQLLNRFLISVQYSLLLHYVYFSIRLNCAHLIDKNLIRLINSINGVHVWYLYERPLAALRCNNSHLVLLGNNPHSASCYLRWAYSAWPCLQAKYSHLSCELAPCHSKQWHGVWVVSGRFNAQNSLWQLNFPRLCGLLSFLLAFSLLIL